MNAEASIRAHEGYREIPYRDHLSYWTVGVGTLIQSMPIPGHIHTCGELLDYLTDPNMHEKWFEKRFSAAQREAAQFVGKDVFRALSQARQDALIELAYWLGYPKLSGFRDFRAALVNGHWVKAEAALLDSLLARQVPGRTKTLASRILEG